MQQTTIWINEEDISRKNEREHYCGKNQIPIVLILGKKNNKYCKIKSDLILMSPKFDKILRESEKNTLDKIKCILSDNNIVNNKNNNIQRRHLELYKIPTESADRVAQDIFAYFNKILN